MKERALEVSVILCMICLVVLGAAIYKVNSESRTADQAQIEENTERGIANARRNERNCARIQVLVQTIREHLPDADLAAKLNAIDRRYPDVPPCPIK